MKQGDWEWGSSITLALWREGLRTRKKLIKGLKVIGACGKMSDDQVAAALIEIREEESDDKILTVSEVKRILMAAKSDYRNEMVG